MKLKELFAKLSYSELSSLAMSNNGSGEIAPNSIVRLIHATNDALKDMYSRLNLYERVLLLQSLEWKSIYNLHKEHAMMDPSTELKYIIDTPSNIFTGDLVKVLSVCNEVGDPLPVNDTEQWASVFLPRFDVIQLTHPGCNQVFSVSYQALHPTLRTEGDGLLEQEIRVPSILEEMLRVRVAFGIFSAMSGQDFTVKSQKLEAIYETRFIDMEQNNLIGDVGLSTNVKLHRRGFP